MPEKSNTGNYPRAILNTHCKKNKANWKRNIETNLLNL
jgi:hypothetical protein